jgi:hypothetical protein
MDKNKCPKMKTKFQILEKIVGQYILFFNLLKEKGTNINNNNEYQ